VTIKEIVAELRRRQAQLAETRDALRELRDQAEQLHDDLHRSILTTAVAALDDYEALQAEVVRLTAENSELRAASVAEPLKVEPSVSRMWMAMHDRICYAGEDEASVLDDYGLVRAPKAHELPDMPWLPPLPPYAPPIDENWNAPHFTHVQMAEYARIYGEAVKQSLADWYSRASGERK
jgi:hypothetical protein